MRVVQPAFPGAGRTARRRGRRSEVAATLPPPITTVAGVRLRTARLSGGRLRRPLPLDHSTRRGSWQLRPSASHAPVAQRRDPQAGAIALLGVRAALQDLGDELPGRRSDLVGPTDPADQLAGRILPVTEAKAGKLVDSISSSTLRLRKAVDHTGRPGGDAGRLALGERGRQHP